MSDQQFDDALSIGRHEQQRAAMNKVLVKIAQKVPFAFGQVSPFKEGYFMGKTEECVFCNRWRRTEGSPNMNPAPLQHTDDCPFAIAVAALIGQPQSGFTEEQLVRGQAHVFSHLVAASIAFDSRDAIAIVTQPDPNQEFVDNMATKSLSDATVPDYE